MKTKPALIIVAAALLLSPLAHAEGELTLQRARELSLAGSATLRSAQLAVDGATLAAKAQGYAALPSLGASAGGSYDYGRLMAGQDTAASAATGILQVSATQTVFDGGKNSALVKKTDLATDAARESLRAARLSLIGQADAAFYALLGAAASVDAAQSDLDAALQRQSIAQAKIDAGILSRSDFLQTQADTAGYETSLILARKTLASAKSRLASLTGLPPATALAAVDFSSYESLLTRLGSLGEAGIDGLTASLTQLARGSSPTLRGYDLDVQQARLAIDIAEKAYLPSVAAGFAQSLSYGQAGGLASSGSISLTASMSLDFWTSRNAVDSASVAAAQAGLAGSQGRTDLELGIAQALYDWLGSAGSIRSASKALDYAQSNYQNVLEKFKLSTATLSDLSTAEALVSADKTALIAARFGFLGNLSALRGLVGLEDEAGILALL